MPFVPFRRAVSRKVFPAFALAALDVRQIPLRIAPVVIRFVVSAFIVIVMLPRASRRVPSNARSAASRRRHSRSSRIALLTLRPGLKRSSAAVGCMFLASGLDGRSRFTSFSPSALSIALPKRLGGSMRPHLGTSVLFSKSCSLKLSNAFAYHFSFQLTSFLSSAPAIALSRSPSMAFQRFLSSWSPPKFSHDYLLRLTVTYRQCACHSPYFRSQALRPLCLWRAWPQL